MIVLIAILGAAAIAAMFVVLMYNGLVVLRNEVKNAWSQIDVQLKRRHDLIPNLVEIVKGYANHEKGTLEAVVKARQQAVSVSGNIPEQAKLESALSQTLKSLFAVTENYPELKANQNFLALQEELSSTENKVSFARQFYNDAVMKLNNKIQLFPSNLIAGLFNFTPADFFQVDSAAERAAPQVKF